MCIRDRHGFSILPARIIGEPRKVSNDESYAGVHCVVDCDSQIGVVGRLIPWLLDGPHHVDDPSPKQLARLDVEEIRLGVELSTWIRSRDKRQVAALNAHAEHCLLYTSDA